MGYRGGSLRHGGTDLLALQGLGQHPALDVFHLQTQQRGHGRGQVHVADFAQLRAALQLIGICFFDAVYTQGQANGASPALQQIQLAGVVLHVGIEVEVRDDGVAQPLLIETKKRLDQLGISGQRPGRGSVPNLANGETWFLQDGPLQARVPPAIGSRCPRDFNRSEKWPPATRRRSKLRPARTRIITRRWRPLTGYRRGRSR